MNIEKTREENTLTIVLEGRLDTTTAPDVEKELHASIEGVESLIWDMEKLEYISSAGLRILLAAQKIMEKQGAMKLVNVSEDIMEILDITGFTGILTIE